MKKYPCRLAENGQCQHGGNKVFNYGFMSGSSSYCRKSKIFLSDMMVCPLTKDKLDNK